MPRPRRIINFHFLALTLTFLLATACGGVEAWTLVRLLTKGEGTYTETEVIEVRNCGVTERKTVNCSAGTWDEFNVSLSGKIVLETGVSSNLGVGRDSGESLDLDSPPEGKVYRYTVNKEFRVVAGEILARSSVGGERRANYAFHAGCSLRIESRDTLTCAEAEKPTPTPQPPPPLSPSSVPIRTSPEQAVKDYYALINQRRYEITWSRLSDHFKSLKNCCTADGQYDYAGYVAWWNSVAQVNINSIYLFEETETSARLIVDISYVRFSQPAYHDPHFQIDLVWDPVGQQWMFYDTKSFRR